MRGLVRGLSPQLVAEPDLNAALWHDADIGTYLERDVRSMAQVCDLLQFHAFLRAPAVRSGSS